MSYYSELIKTLGPGPIEASLGQKPTDREELRARQREAHRVTELMEESKSFSFLRLGEMEIGLLLALQEDCHSDTDVFGDTFQVNGTVPSGCPGIGLESAERLVRAFRNCNYLAYCEKSWPNSALVPRLKLDRRPDLYRNPDIQTSFILLTWVETEFRSYCERNRVGFSGAESAVLEVLAGDNEFRRASLGIWPEKGHQFFLQPKGNGSNLATNLDQIKTQLLKFIDETGVDTLFISLGGAAKILCYELALERQVRCVDFGAMMRSLCYLGSDGNRAGRSTHSPFFYRVPFSVVMRSVRVAFPQLADDIFLAKSHAQAILELQRKEIGWTSPSNALEFSKSNLENFRTAAKETRKLYFGLSKTDELRLERKRFLHFCGSHSLSYSGIAYLQLFRAKSIVAKSLRKIRQF